MSAANGTESRITYGNLSRVGRKGLFGASMPVFVAGIVAIVVSMILFLLVKWWIGLLAALLFAIAIAPMAIPVGNGRSVYQLMGLRLGQRRAKGKGRNVLVNGPAGKVPDGKFRLPGIAQQSKVRDWQTGFGMPFALISIPSTNHYSVVLEVHPTGGALVDQRTIDGQVAHWGAWLAYLGTERSIVGASVTVETSIDSGLRLRKAVLTPVREDASEFGHAVAEEMAGGFGQRTPAITTRVAITFSGKVDGEKRSEEEVADEIANILPGLMDHLTSTGAGSHVRPCTSQDLTDYVRAAYDPHVAAQIEEQRGQGGTGLTWDQAGPAFHDVELDHYRHDRAVSMTWTLGGEPRGTFYDTSLSRLLSPDPKVARKRVTLLYRPISPSRTTAIADAKVRNASFVASSSKRRQAVSQSVMRSANQTAQEEAAGAGMVTFGMVVTATVLNPEDLRVARQTIGSQSAQARLRLRLALGSQDSAFVAGLPLGVVLPYHTVVSADFTDRMV